MLFNHKHLKPNLAKLPKQIYAGFDMRDGKELCLVLHKAKANSLYVWTLEKEAHPVYLQIDEVANFRTAIVGKFKLVADDIRMNNEANGLLSLSFTEHAAREMLAKKATIGMQQSGKTII